MVGNAWGTPADRSATTFGSSPAETTIAPVEPHSHAAGDAGPQFGNQSEAPIQNPAMAGFGVTPQISISHVASQNGSPRRERAPTHPSRAQPNGPHQSPRLATSSPGSSGRGIRARAKCRRCPWKFWRLGGNARQPEMDRRVLRDTRRGHRSGRPPIQGGVR